MGLCCVVRFVMLCVFIFLPQHNPEYVLDIEWIEDRLPGQSHGQFILSDSLSFLLRSRATSLDILLFSCVPLLLQPRQSRVWALVDLS